MPVNSIEWAHPHDIHLVAGATSRPLSEELRIYYGSPQHMTLASAPPANVDVVFRPAFTCALTPAEIFIGFGVTVHRRSGVVTFSGHAAAGHRLRTFLIHAEVRDRTYNPPRPSVQRIRVHLHDLVRNAWVTPQQLTIHRGADGQRFSVLAQFDDDTVGDVTQVPGITWRSADDTIIGVGPANGELTAKAVSPVNGIDITATLPAAFGGFARDGQAVSVASWDASPLSATLLYPLDSAGAARMTEPSVLNFLFLPEGFTTGEQAIFEGKVQQFVDFLRTQTATRPFDLCRREMNYWMAWLETPSATRGTSPLFEVKPTLRANGSTYAQQDQIPLPMDPRPTPDDPVPANLAFSLPQLIHEVGLPVPDDFPNPAPATGVDWALAFVAQLLRWDAVYGGLSAHVDLPLYKSWLELRDRRLVNETNTLFGLGLGARPSAEYVLVDRLITPHPLRTSRAHLDSMLSKIEDAANPGPAIGAVWGGAAGKDRSFVVFLCAGAARGGGRSPAGEIITASLAASSDVELTPMPGRRGFDSAPHGTGGRPALDIHCMIAHESAHAMTLGDEYGTRPSLPMEAIADVNSYANLQDTASASFPPPQLGIDPARLKWNWPRIARAGVLTAVPEAHVLGFLLTLRDKHAEPFQVGDPVRLRTRPLTAGIVPSVELPVVDKLSDHQLIVQAPPPLPPFNPALYVSGSIAYVQTERITPPATRGTPLGLIAPNVLAHMTQHRIPLNVALVAAGNHQCAPDGRPVQPALNKPGTVPFGWPRSAWIVGAFEGGHQYGCGVLHPTGACIMRLLVLPQDKAYQAFKVRDVAYRFCAVCRYILVDRIDPSQHGAIDKDYGGRYAEPR